MNAVSLFVTQKSWHFVASEDIITKVKSQSLYTIKIKYWNASGSGFPPSLIPALQNIGILHHKKAKLPKHLQHSVCQTKYNCEFYHSKIEIETGFEECKSQNLIMWIPCEWLDLFQREVSLPGNTQFSRIVHFTSWPYSPS